MTSRGSGGWRSGGGRRRGAVRRRGGTTFRQALTSWLADRTIRRKWRRVRFGEWLILSVAVVVVGAFLILLGMQIPWLAWLVGLGLLVYLYLELGAK